MEGHQAPRSGPEESFEFVYRQEPMHALVEHQYEHGLEQSQPPPPPQVAYSPYIQEFVQVMREMTQKPIGSTLDDNYEKIRKQSAKGLARTTDLMVAEEWLRNTERVLNRFECTTEKKVSYAVSLFEQDALDWWEIISGSKEEPMALTWADFLKEFSDKYMPIVYKDRKKLEFLELKQNDLAVADYEMQIVRLSKYAPEEVATSELKRDRFERGLNLEIREKIAVKPPTYRDLMEAVLRAEETILERKILEVKEKETKTTKVNENLSFRSVGSRQSVIKKREVSQVNSPEEGSTTKKFKQSNDKESVDKSISVSGTTALMCNECGKLYEGECWRTKSRVCFYYRQSEHFIIDYSIKKNDEES